MIEDKEREFEIVDGAWQDQKFFIYEQFRFPDDQFKINLEAIRNFARGVGHFINEKKLEKALNPDPAAADTPVTTVAVKKPAILSKKIIWFRWGTYETHKYDARYNKFFKIDHTENNDQMPPFKHLYFSSVCHMPDGQGNYLTGGCDEYNNFYRRALFYKKYEKFDIVASMIRNRSFHASVYHKKRHEIYVIGGN